MYRTYGPYLIFSNPTTPAAWGYFSETEGVYTYYEMVYPETFDTLWFKKSLDNDIRLYAVDNTISYCFLFINKQLHRASTQKMNVDLVLHHLEQPSSNGDWRVVEPLGNNVSDIILEFFPKKDQFLDKIAPPELPKKITLEEAFDLLLTQKCSIIEEEPSSDAILPNNEMRVWRQNELWHYRVTLLNQCISGVFSTTLDKELINDLDKRGLGELNLEENTHRNRFSRDYLKLTHVQQSNVYTVLRFGWPELEILSTQELSELYQHILLGTQPNRADYAHIPEKERQAIEAKYSEFSDTFTMLRPYLTPHHVNLSFKDFYKTQSPTDNDNITINDIICFVRTLLIAAMTVLKHHPLPNLPPVKDCYDIPCGALKENVLEVIETVSPADSKLFLLVMNHETFRPNNQTYDKVFEDIHGIIYPPLYQHKYTNVTNNLLNAFKKNFHGHAETYLTMACITMLMSMVSLRYAEQNSELLEHMKRLKNQLKDLIKNGNQLIWLIPLLSKKIANEMIHELLSKFTTILQNNKQLIGITSFLKENSRYKLIKSLGVHRDRLITNESDLVGIIKKFSTLRQKITDLLHPQIIKIINSWEKLEYILSNLDNPSLFILVLKLSFTIEISQLLHLLDLLPIDHRFTLLTNLGENIREVIHTTEDLDSVLTQLEPAQRTPLITLLVPNLPTLITDSYQLIQILEKLPKEERHVLITALGDHSKTLIQNSEQLEHIFSLLSDQDIFRFIMAIGTKATDFEFINAAPTLHHKIKEVFLKNNLPLSAHGLKKYALLMNDISNNTFKMQYGLDYNFFMTCVLSSIGIAILIIAFTLCHVAGMSLLGISIAAIGVTTTLSSIGFYRAATVKRPELENIENDFAIPIL
ncbi:MAG: hypothetical protein CK424_01370 [Legionella sp.]|nr:MAG: hypothetical protein CK424_01370 [Legionella sp.]